MKPAVELSQSSSDSDIDMSVSYSLRKHGPAELPDEVIIKPQVNRETRRLLKLARIELPGKAMRLQFDNDMQKTWF